MSDWYQARTLEDGSGQVRYLAAGLDIDDATLHRVVGWLTAGDQDGRIPHGHAAGRLVMQVLGVPAALLAGTAALVALAGWSWSVLS